MNDLNTVRPTIRKLSWVIMYFEVISRALIIHMVTFNKGSSIKQVGICQYAAERID